MYIDPALRYGFGRSSLKVLRPSGHSISKTLRSKEKRCVKEAGRTANKIPGHYLHIFLRPPQDSTDIQVSQNP